MKTILHTIDTTGPGGAETVFIDIADRLPRQHYRSIVCIRGPGWVEDELRRRGFEPVMIPAKGSFNLRYLRALMRLIRERDVDLVQSHLLGANVYCSLAGWLTSTPVVATFHGMVDVGLDERFRGLKSAVINRGARAIVAVSAGLRDNIIARTSLRSDRVEVVYNGIDTAAFRRERQGDLKQRFGWQADDVLVGCLGNVRPAKGYDILLQAARLAQQQGSRLRFVVAGQGREDLDGPLQQYLQQHGLQQDVRFLGFIDDAAGFLANLDIFLLPSTSEGFSIATIQAMAAGLPVLVTRSGGPEEIVEHDVTGLLVEPGDAGEIAAGLQALAQDAELRRRLAAAGREHALATFDIQAMIDAYSGLYDRLL